MKITMKKSFAVIMALVMCVSMLFGVQITSFAADTNTVNYVYSGDKVYNWGERGTTATFLSPMAIDFYSANGVTLDELLALNGSSTESGVPSSALFGELHKLMESNHDYITSYDATKNLFQYTDCQNSGGKISSFYSGTAIGPSWDGGWNREHVWPNSKGDKAGNGENDLMMLRPTSTSENSSRGNKAYGTTTTSSYYNPNDEGDGAYDLRGDCARIILYQYVRWECTNTGSSYNSTGIFGSDGVIESKDVLLDWIEADPVDTWELGRNDAAESILGTRNVFVDYPELAFDLFNEDIPANYTSPSGGVSVEGGTSGSTGEDADDTTNEDVVAPETATYVFSDYTAGTQYANETLTLDDIVTATSYNSNCHFTTQLRMYNSHTSKSGGMVILSSKSEVSSISLKAGYKATSLAIYSSSDGATWSSPTSLTLTTSYKDFSVDLPAGTKYIKIENTGTAQARIESITLTFASTGGDTTSPVITALPNDDSYGKVEVSGNYIIATPNEGYEVAGYKIVSGNTNATVTPSGNIFTVETTADVTIQINFVARTQYTVTFKEMGSTTSTQNAYSGDSITLPTITSDDYTVVGWVAAEIDGETTDKPTVYNAGSSYEVTGNITFYALYSRTEAGGSGESNVFTKYTGAITEGDYIIVGANSTSSATPYGAMNTSKNNNKNRLDYTEITVTNDTITTDDSYIIWHIASSGDGYWTIYNEAAASYAAGNGTKNLAVLETSVTDYAKWNITGTTSHILENVGNKTASVNYTLRRNGTSGYACYSSTQGTAPVLYKRTAAAMTTYYFTSAGETPDYTVTANANNAEYGEVKVSGTTIVATPNEGYTVSGYDITSGTATVTREGNTFFVTPSSNVAITIKFEALPTYTVTFIGNGVEVDPVSTYSGGIIKLPDYSGELDEYTTFDGWAENKDETDATKIYAAKATFVVTKNVTLYAQFTVTEPEVPEESDHYFVKVTEDQTDWTGTYLIVYEDGNKAFNGGLIEDLDVANNYIAVTIAGSKIAATPTNVSALVTIEKTTDGYTIKSASGFYIGQTSDANDLKCNKTTQYVNSISIDNDGYAVITSGGAFLRYNAASGNDRFRFYKSTTYADQQPIALYKLDVAEISGAQVTVGADLSINYYVDVTNVASISDGDLAMRFTAEGDETSTTVEFDKSKTEVIDGKTYYVFTFAGLAPQRMTDNIKAELLLNGAVVDVLADYSIQQNAINLLAAYPNDTQLKRFISDMLYYGKAAQLYRGYNTDKLATNGVDILDQTTTAPDRLRGILSGETSGASFGSATVWFDAVNSLVVKINNSENVEKVVAVIDGNEVTLDYHEATKGYITDGIKATDFATEYVFKIYEEGNAEAVQTLIYSVNAYASSKYDSNNSSEEMKQLALALYNYGKSAKEYAESLK